MRSSSASIARATSTVKLWPHRDPEGEEDLAAIVLCVLLQGATTSSSWVKHYSKVGPRNTDNAHINYLLSTDAFSLETPFVSELQWTILIYCWICT